MIEIRSKINNELLHIVFRKEDFELARRDIIDIDQYLQCAALKMDAGKTFRPHKHIVQERTYTDYIPQESWVVISGGVQCFFYDTDDSLIWSEMLLAGDASFTLKGGHTYKIIEDKTLVYEFKTGPYLGQYTDKTFIE